MAGDKKVTGVSKSNPADHGSTNRGHQESGDEGESIPEHIAPGERPAQCSPWPTTRRSSSARTARALEATFREGKGTGRKGRSRRAHHG
jgi:hypothetical protein